VILELFLFPNALTKGAAAPLEEGKRKGFCFLSLKSSSGCLTLRLPAGFDPPRRKVPSFRWFSLFPAGG
jgi:hypothetical protein